MTAFSYTFREKGHTGQALRGGSWMGWNPFKLAGTSKCDNGVRFRVSGASLGFHVSDGGDLRTRIWPRFCAGYVLNLPLISCCCGHVSNLE